VASTDPDDYLAARSLLPLIMAKKRRQEKREVSRPPLGERCPVLAVLSPLSSPAWLGSADPGAGAIR